MVLNFKKYGFSLSKNIFSNQLINKFEDDFDQIVDSLIDSDEDVNARWDSPLNNSLNQKNSMVIHTHNVQSYSSLMLHMLQHDAFLNKVEELIGSDIILHHTKLFLKPAKVGSLFPLHQDWSYFPTLTNTMIAAVIHLSDSTEEMGCFRVIPSSHKLGKIKNSDGHKHLSEIHSKYNLKNAKPIIANKGDILFFHCCLLHGSLPNLSDLPRKTILIQLYSGNDKIIEGNKHTNVQLVLRGRNNFATRSSVSNL